MLDSVDNLMAESHELGGSTVVVDRATPKVCKIAPDIFCGMEVLFLEDFRLNNIKVVLCT